MARQLSETPTGERRVVKIGHSPVMHAYLAIFTLIWVVIGVAFTADLAADKTPFVILPTAFVIAFISIGWVAQKVSVRGTSDELKVRNYFGRQRLARRSIRGFEVSNEGKVSWLGTTVHVRMRDGSEVTLDVFTRPLVTASSRKRLEDSVRELQTWLRG